LALVTLFQLPVTLKLTTLFIYCIAYHLFLLPIIFLYCLDLPHVYIVSFLHRSINTQVYVQSRGPGLTLSYIYRAFGFPPFLRHHQPHELTEYILFFLSYWLLSYWLITTDRPTDRPTDWQTDKQTALWFPIWETPFPPTVLGSLL